VAQQRARATWGCGVAQPATHPTFMGIVRLAVWTRSELAAPPGMHASRTCALSLRAAGYAARGWCSWLALVAGARGWCRGAPYRVDSETASAVRTTDETLAASCGTMSVDDRPLPSPTRTRARMRGQSARRRRRLADAAQARRLRLPSPSLERARGCARPQRPSPHATRPPRPERRRVHALGTLARLSPSSWRR